MISKPDEPSEYPRGVENPRANRDPSGPELAGLRPDVGQSRGNPRALAIADLYRHAEALARAGDLSAARTIHDAIGRLLGDAASGASHVVDLADARGRRDPKR